MSDGRYFWLKMMDDFFSRKEIKKLRRVAGGDTLVVIYLKILLLSVKNGGIIYFQGVEDSLAQELALDIDEDEQNISIVLKFAQKYKLVECGSSDSEFLMCDAAKYVGSENKATERVRRFRDKQKALQCNGDVTQLQQSCNTEKSREEIRKEQKKVDTKLVVDTSEPVDNCTQQPSLVSQAHVSEDKPSLVSQAHVSEDKPVKARVHEEDDGAACLLTQSFLQHVEKMHECAAKQILSQPVIARKYLDKYHLSDLIAAIDLFIAKNGRVTKFFDILLADVPPIGSDWDKVRQKEKAKKPRSDCTKCSGSGWVHHEQYETYANGLSTECTCKYL